ncbi:uncharacterized protein PGTG_04152 [Puccinia graminis f. sp. tritici CRL 75-36-700-3]|uniref:GH18 domain-containing protein n=1 Tax=Puccinia graminis f. sp. tritici (strain CRL 75-36-700-3 / race SCCL) TaxID=418459 RepID=E3K1M1_PUCGT|nr:uncharacterized protein PGTG_04152 [Puccinia graminis f. sp. tritici CRL 75-36-700-3]EFP78196.2 hypothetical protein PGTG_04152 [Puccinia graminis f. sp. tritici CRL 75-36-700-3]
MQSSWSFSSSKSHSNSAELNVTAGNLTNDTMKSKGSNINTKKTGKRNLAGYYPVYNFKGQPLSELRYDLYDEIIFFATSTTQNFTLGIDYMSESEWGELAADFVKTCKNYSVRPMYSVGGWCGSKYFSSLAATAENRTAFADSTISFAKKYGFEGIDFDWLYPSIQGLGCNTISENDVVNQQLLFKEVKQKWPEGKLSAAQSPSGIRNSNYQELKSSDLTLMAEVVDELRILAHDVYGSSTKTTGPSAPISSRCADSENKVSVEDAIEVYLKQGFKPEQLSLAIPGFGKSWTLAQPELTPKVVGEYTSYYYQNYTGIPPGGKWDDEPGVDDCGKKTGWGGIWLVKELVQDGFLSKDEMHGMKGFTRYYDACSGQPFLARNTTMISYDDTQSTLAKVKYAKSKGLGGVVFFDTMGPRDKTVKAARKALFN